MYAGKVTVFARVPVAAARTWIRSPATTTRSADVAVKVSERFVFAARAVPPVAFVVFASVAASIAAVPAPA